MKYFSLLLIVVFICGCDNAKTLTKERALSILQSSDMRKHSLTFGGGYVSVHPARSREPSNYSKFLLAAESAGLIKIGTGTAFMNTVWEPHFSGKAAEYIVNEAGSSIDGGPFLAQHSKDKINGFIMSIPEATEVTGVGAPSQIGGKTVSAVQFRINYKPTPFGKVYAQATGITNEFSGHAEAEAQFALYDSGWKLESWSRK